jgi:hypothetical protein
LGCLGFYEDTGGKLSSWYLPRRKLTHPAGLAVEFDASFLWLLSQTPQLESKRMIGKNTKLMSFLIISLIEITQIWGVYLLKHA